MSNRIRTKPRLLGNVKGLAATAILVGTLVHTKPVLPFVLPTQVFTDRDGYICDVQDGSQGEPRIAGVEYHIEIDPRRVTPELNNHVAAVADRLSAAQRMMEKMASVQLSPGSSPRPMTEDDLPDKRLLVNVYAENDKALDARLLAIVTVDELGNTNWDYEDENGRKPNLTATFLTENPQVANAIHLAVNEWLNFSRKSLAGDTLTTSESGGREWTSETRAVSSSVLPGNSTVAENGATTSALATHPNGLS